LPISTLFPYTTLFRSLNLATNFVNSTVTLGVTDFEADVNPRTVGNHALDILDWNQVGKFVAGIDAVSNGAEFQRADDAPTNTGGDRKSTRLNSSHDQI